MGIISTIILVVIDGKIFSSDCDGPICDQLAIILSYLIFSIVGLVLSILILIFGTLNLLKFKLNVIFLFILILL
jgi:hypothetical protein